MERKRGNIFILALICFILVSSLSLDTVFSYFSDDIGASGGTSMGYIRLVSLTNLDGSAVGEAQTLESDQTFTGEYKLITDTNINFYVYVFLKGTITPSGNKTHDTQCSDYYADDTDCLDISVSTGYSKLSVKSSDGYTIYYKLCTIQTAGQVQQTFSVSASIKTNLIENGCDYYKDASISLDMKVKTKQADFLEAQEYTLGFSSSLINKDLCSIGFKTPIYDITAYPNLTFTILDATSKTMSVGAANTSITTANIPAQVEKDGEIYTITTLPSSAFLNCTNLTSVKIPNGVTSIGNGAFYRCTSLSSVSIPDGVTSIEHNTFVYCSGLTTVTIPDCVTSIGYRAFYNCSSLTSITFPSGLTSIGGSAFDGCKGLTSLVFPEGLASIQGFAFHNCSRVTSVTFPSSFTSIATEAFSGCTALETVTIPSDISGISISGDTFDGCTNLQYNIYDNAKYLGNADNPYVVLMEATSTSITTCTINSNCKALTGYGFGNCTNLNSITIPNGVRSIDYAFSECTNLTSITIPNSVTSIGYSAFSGCSALTSITIPNSVTSIGYSAFQNCSSLTSITIPNSVTSIGNSAFSGCSALTTITIPESIASIESSTFSSCTNLTSVTIPNSVTSIGYSAFQNCSSLTSITIPDSVTNIGSYAFYNCTNLTSVTFENITGWHLDSTTGTSINVSNPTTNATNMKSSSGAWYSKNLYRV